MTKIKVTSSKALPTTDFGTLEPDKEYSVNASLAGFLVKRGLAEVISAPKRKAAKKKAAK